MGSFPHACLSLLNEERYFFLDRLLIALVVLFLRLRDLLQVPVSPVLQGLQGFGQGAPQGCERIFDDWRHDRVDDAQDQAIAFQIAQGLGQHFS